MAVFTFPMLMPWDHYMALGYGPQPVRVRAVTFEHDPQEAFAPEAGGRFVSVQLGPSLWRMSLATPVLSEPQFDMWRSWFDKLEGSQNDFYAYDVRRPMPRNYRNGYTGLVRAGGSTSFISGDAVVSSINSRREEITNLSGSGTALPVGFQLEIGDYCSLKWIDPTGGILLASLHRIVLRPAAANSSGVTTIHVRPRVHPDIPSANTTMAFGSIDLEPPNRAQCIMRLTRRDRQAEAKSRSVSFEAVQSLRFK